MAKRNDLTICQKIALLKKYDELPKCSQRKAAAELKISQPLLCKLLKNKNNILGTSVSDGDFARKRRRDVKDLKVEDALFKWFVEAKRADLQVSRRIIANKAETLAIQFGNTKFKASDGWLSRWKQRNNIGLKNLKKDANQSNTSETSFECAEQADVVNSTCNTKDSSNTSSVSVVTSLDACAAKSFYERINKNLKCDKDKDKIQIPPFEEIKKAIYLLREAVMSYNNSTLDDFQNMYNIETSIKKIYNNQEI